MVMTARHGHTVGKVLSPTYISWRCMKNRCRCKAHHNYKRYGGRGIKVCERWLKFENFLEDMGEKSQGTTIDRIDNDGNYGPGNCKWSTPVEQCKNRRKRGPNR